MDKFILLPGCSYTHAQNLDTIRKFVSELGSICSSTRKNILEMQKIWNKNMARTSRRSICGQEVSRKNNIFCYLCRKDKKMSCEKPFVTIKICLFYTRHRKYRFSVKRLREHLECRNTRMELFVRIF